jgi:hypothetical protein
VDTGAAGIHCGLALLLALPLLYAAASKLLDPYRFVTAIPQFGFTALAARASTARIVGVLEGLVGGALVATPVAGSAIVAGVLYLTFSGVLQRARLNGAVGECGCFGALSGRIDAISIGRNLALALTCFGLAYVRGVGILGTYASGLAAVLVVTVVVASAAADTVLELRRR